MKKIFFVLMFALLRNQASSQSGSVNVECWLTKADRSALFEKQPDIIQFSSKNKGIGIPIVIDYKQTLQVMDGFGFALTGGSAELMMKMSAAERAKLVKKIFSADDDNAGISYIRLSIGASDMNSFVFSYDDLPAGETDFELKKFNLAQDLKDVVPVMKQILAIDPSIKILGSPWSAPTWMKTNNAAKKGSLKIECYDVYARYFVKYIEAMRKEGIVIDAVTIQNEPLNANNTPSMPWYPGDAALFIKNNLGPAFKKAGVSTKIILFDHNCDRPDYPLSILSDPEAAQYVDGSGFHLYAGDISALSMVHTARPDKNVYFTEQMTVEKPGTVPMRLTDPVKRLIIGAPRNWSKNVILWNLAADSLNNPHTNDGGCPMCQGAVTIDGDKVGWNIAYFAIAHASKFVRPGSVRIASTASGDAVVNLTRDEEEPGVMRSTIISNADVLPNVAFKTPAGKIVLIIGNDKGTMQRFSIQYKGMTAMAKLDAGSVATYVWQHSE